MAASMFSLWVFDHPLWDGKRMKNRLFHSKEYCAVLRFTSLPFLLLSLFCNSFVTNTYKYCSCYTSIPIEISKATLLEILWNVPAYEGKTVPCNVGTPPQGKGFALGHFLYKWVNQFSNMRCCTEKWQGQRRPKFTWYHDPRVIKHCNRKSPIKNSIHGDFQASCLIPGG